MQVSEVERKHILRAIAADKIRRQKRRDAESAEKRHAYQRGITDGLKQLPPPVSLLSGFLNEVMQEAAHKFANVIAEKMAEEIPHHVIHNAARVAWRMMCVNAISLDQANMILYREIDRDCLRIDVRLPEMRVSTNVSRHVIEDMHK